MGAQDMELDSPDSFNPEDAQAAGDAAAENPESSTGADDDEFDLLSVVRNAGAQEEGADDPASSANSENDSSDPESAAAEDQNDRPAEPDNENFSDAPFHNHPRFKQLIEQRNGFKQDAEQYQKLQGFLRETNVSSDEAAQALQLAALMKSDPAKAWEQLKPIAQQLLNDTGLTLPQDLQQRVQSRELTAAAAQEISRLRANQATAQRNDEANRARSQQEAQANAVRSAQEAAGQWEMGVRGKDPDFEAKIGDLQREVVFLQRSEGRPTDPAAVRAQLQTALENVNTRFAAARAQPKREQRPLTGGRAAGATATAEPSSVLDIVRAGRVAG